MTNHFEELHKQGITHTEMSMQELQELYKDGKITSDQFNRILMDNLGTKKFMELFNLYLEENYSKDLLKKPLPESLKMICEEPKNA